GKAAETGILFKGGEHLERTHQLNTIILDKTGTITHGKPVVTDYTGDQTALQLLASAERSSEHPLADAIVNYAMEQHISFIEPEEFTAIPGHGIKACIDGDYILVGTRKLMEDNLVTIAKAEEQLINYEQNGKTRSEERRVGKEYRKR